LRVLELTHNPNNGSHSSNNSRQPEGVLRRVTWADMAVMISRGNLPRECWLPLAVGLVSASEHLNLRWFNNRQQEWLLNAQLRMPNLAFSLNHSNNNSNSNRNNNSNNRSSSSSNSRHKHRSINHKQQEERGLNKTWGDTAAMTSLANPLLECWHPPEAQAPIFLEVIPSRSNNSSHRGLRANGPLKECSPVSSVGPQLPSLRNNRHTWPCLVLSPLDRQPAFKRHPEVGLRLRSDDRLNPIS